MSHIPAPGIVRHCLNLARSPRTRYSAPFVGSWKQPAADLAGSARHGERTRSPKRYYKSWGGLQLDRGRGLSTRHVLLLARGHDSQLGELPNQFGVPNAWISGNLMLRSVRDSPCSIGQTYANRSVPAIRPGNERHVPEGQIAAIISEETGRDVRYRYLSPCSTGARDLRTRTGKHARFTHITSMARCVRTTPTDLAPRDVDPLRHQAEWAAGAEFRDFHFRPAPLTAGRRVTAVERLCSAV